MKPVLTVLSQAQLKCFVILHGGMTTSYYVAF